MRTFHFAPDLPEELVLDKHMVHLLFATCTHYRAMVPDDVLRWLKGTWDIRYAYSKTAFRNPRVRERDRKDIPLSKMDLLLEQVATDDNLATLKWLVNVALVPPTSAQAFMNAGKDTRPFLAAKGCPRLPAKRERAVVTHGPHKGEKGILIGIDVNHRVGINDGIVKFQATADTTPIKIISMRHLEFCAEA